ncbi:hypothetical protein EST92_26315 [Streptomyces sp. TM32]|uniref:hypothetical protein n=1 Tax=Streptomyces sp. TM32 TaxID=1652669 RepID=UPI001010AB89|nr:hypothetical protein [Streptomyces sp. TM32]RXS68752.1 hypothetical protein EST92_26315 [Streptomyces sp. TM32]
MTSLAKSVGKAAGWMVRQLAEAIESPHQIDLAGAGFVRTYAVVFAASSILVLVLWLKAVAKRAVNGAKLTTAMGEAVGLLWVAVAVTAFSPAILYVVIEAVSALTKALASALGSNGDLFTTMARDLESGAGGGGPLIWLIRGLLALLLCGTLWLLMVLRGLALLVGEVLGILVFAGLVDRDWWGKCRRWSGGILAIVGIEPIIVIVLGLAAALQGEHGSVMTGLAVTGLAIGASVMLILRVPGMGDAFKVARIQGRMAGRVAGSALNAMANSAGTGGSGAAAGVMRGISTHSDRSSGASSGGRSSTVQNGPQGGIAAHSQRKARPPRQKDQKDTGS